MCPNLGFQRLPQAHRTKSEHSGIFIFSVWYRWAADEAMERSTERAASPTAIDQTRPTSDGISHTLGPIQNGSQDYYSPKAVLSTRQIGFEPT